jgi:hypothetical protein
MMKMIWLLWVKSLLLKCTDSLLVVLQVKVALQVKVGVLKAVHQVKVAPKGLLQAKVVLKAIFLLFKEVLLLPGMVLAALHPLLVDRTEKSLEWIKNHQDRQETFNQ